MKTSMLATGHNHKVFFSVVSSIMIDMMDYFIRCKQSTQFVFHDQAMLRYVALLGTVRMIRGVNHYVASAMKRSPSMPLMRLLAFPFLLGMALQKWDRVPPKMAQIAVGVFRQRRWLTTTAFANPARNFLGLRNIRIGRRAMFIEVFGRMIAVMRLEGNRLPATAGANWESVRIVHRGIIADCRRKCNHKMGVLPWHLSRARTNTVRSTS